VNQWNDPVLNNVVLGPWDWGVIYIVCYAYCSLTFHKLSASQMTYIVAVRLNIYV